MGEIVNLRRARKAKQRVAEAAAADENRRRSGMTKVERAASERERAALGRTLDGARLEAPPDPPSSEKGSD